MKPPRSLTSAVLFLAWSDTARAGWYLDYSCYDQAENIKRSMASAFDLAAAGSQALEQAAAPLSGSATPERKKTHQAQVDLVSYVFQEMMNGKTVNKNSPEYINGKSVLDDVQQFKEFKGIVYPAEIEWVDRLIAAGQGKTYKAPPSKPADVTMLGMDEYKVKENFFMYCNFSRFGDIDVNCLGKQVSKAAGDTKHYRCNKALNHMESESALSEKCRTQDPKAKGLTEVNPLHIYPPRCPIFSR